MSATSLTPLTRRDFLSTSAKLGAFIAAAPYISRGADAAKSDQVNVALIGCGEQGRILANAALKIPGVRFKAVCDIWTYNRTYAERLLKKFGHEAKPFEDYREVLVQHSGPRRRHHRHA
jgi:ornithine cyclodeaminase/alanine dehydrogenase-like protein (mu-crystallin family)